VWIVLSPLRVVDQSGKDDDAENKEEDEEGEFMGARLERLYEDLQSTGMWIRSSGEGTVSPGVDLQSGGVTCQFEQTHDPDHTKIHTIMNFD